MTAFTLVPKIEQNPALVEFAQGLVGKLVILLCCYLFLEFIAYPWAWQTVLVLLPISLFPQWRRQLLFVGTAAFWITGQNWLNDLLVQSLHFNSLVPAFELGVFARAIGYFAVLVIFTLIYVFFTKTNIGKRVSLPFFWVIAIYLSVLIVLSYLPLSDSFISYFWLISIYFAGLLWFFGYSLEERHNKSLPKITGQYSHYLPFWMPTVGTPMTKGASYLKKIEAKNPRALATSQLKGLKLLYWAFIIYLVTTLLTLVFYGASPYLINGYQFQLNEQSVLLVQNNQTLLTFFNLPFDIQVPSFRRALQQCQMESCFSLTMNWQILAAWFTTTILQKAVYFHIIISLVRLAGFNALRGMNNPLASRSIADFWNRFDYYYKEMLVNLFYLPFFFRFFKKSPQLRMYFSLIVAVFIGNTLYHFLWFQRFIIDRGFFEALYAYRVDAFFAFLLANCLFISQWLQQGHVPSRHWLMVNVINPSRVMLIFCLLWIFADGRIGDDILTRVRFFYSLFGLDI